MTRYRKPLRAATPRTSQQAQQFLRNSQPSRERPVVKIPGGATSITQSAEALFEAVAPTKELFYRGGVVVELVREAEGYRVQIVDAVAAQSRFEKYVRFFKTTKSGETIMDVQTTISEAIAKQYLKSEACRNLLPKLNGVLNCPVLVEKDGRLHRVDHGYDEVTGYFVTSEQSAGIRFQVEEALWLLMAYWTISIL